MTDMTRISEAWLFGTRKLKYEMEHDQAVTICQHTWPNGQYLDFPVMTWEEAEAMLDTGDFPDHVYNAFLQGEQPVEVS